ncbi:MAG: DUF5615 family PIN-like protein [Chloroflexota bacterium]
MRFATDENFHGRVLAELQQRLPDLDIVRVQDTDMVGATDPDLLEWLATEDRILLTHDVNTMRGFAYDRVRDGQPMPGVVLVRDDIGIGRMIDELELLIGAGNASDFENIVRFVP